MVIESILVQISAAVLAALIVATSGMVFRIWRITERNKRFIHGEEAYDGLIQRVERLEEQVKELQDYITHE